MTRRPRAIVYVDAFNLYKNALQRKGPGYKWLDVKKLSDDLLQQYEVIGLKYFTAELKPREDDPQIVMRQRTYLRALECLSNVSIHLGHFKIHKPWLPVHPRETDETTGKSRTVQVKRPEEKGSDVNLASHMLVDAFFERADLYVVLSNDSDYAEPLTLMKQKLGKKTGLIFPTSSVSKKLLSTHPDIVRHLRDGAIVNAQLPPKIIDAHGRIIHKPPLW